MDGARVKRTIETKASSHQGQRIPAGYCHAHMQLYASGVNYNVNNMCKMAKSNVLGNYAHIHIHGYLYQFVSGNSGQCGKRATRRQPYVKPRVGAFVGPSDLAVFSGW